MSEPIELKLPEPLICMGIAKMHKTTDNNDIPVLIIIPRDETNNKTIQFEIGETPYTTAQSCEVECRDYLHRNIISALSKFITHSWEQIKLEDENDATEEQNTEKKEKISYCPRYSDEEKSFLAEAILIDREPCWLVSEKNQIRYSRKEEAL